MTRKQVMDEICKPMVAVLNEILADMTDKERNEWADRLVDVAKDTAVTSDETPDNLLCI